VDRVGWHGCAGRTEAEIPQRSALIPQREVPQAGVLRCSPLPPTVATSKMSGSTPRERLSAMTEPLSIAEDAWAYVVPYPSMTRFDPGDVVLNDGPSPHHWSANANRIRFGASSADKRIDDVRAWYAERGRDRFCWVVGSSATPAGIADRLMARGAVPDPDDPVVVPMVLDREPPPGPPGIEVRRVERLDDYRRMQEIVWESFAIPADVQDAERARLAEAWAEAEADARSVRYLAYVDGDAVACGVLVRLAVGPPYLGGGATIPSARGRGVYRALVRARWDEAVRLGDPALIVQAGQMSRPVLERLGFRAGREIHTLVDRATPGSADDGAAIRG
jgi:GNAT superfamily N-acetyltransferase